MLEISECASCNWNVPMVWTTMDFIQLVPKHVQHSVQTWPQPVWQRQWPQHQPHLHQ
jgi:hypothetical protein